MLRIIKTIFLQREINSVNCFFQTQESYFSCINTYINTFLFSLCFFLMQKNISYNILTSDTALLREIVSFSVLITFNNLNFTTIFFFFFKKGFSQENNYLQKKNGQIIKTAFAVTGKTQLRFAHVIPPLRNLGKLFLLYIYFSQSLITL